MPVQVINILFLPSRLPFPSPRWSAPAFPPRRRRLLLWRAHRTQGLGEGIEGGGAAGVLITGRRRRRSRIGQDGLAAGLGRRPAVGPPQSK